jgi:hypothetical protein
MAQPKVQGRLLPRNDWEGDDQTVGAGGGYVTCQDTSVGRMVAYASNGRFVKDGRLYRAAVQPHDSGGISLQQAAAAAKRLSGRTLVLPGDWDWQDALDHLKRLGGLVVDGYYGAIPRSKRFQANADFFHAMFISHYSSTAGFRVWDPLNPDAHGYGIWFKTYQIKAFFTSIYNSRVLCGYVKLEPLG